MSNNSASRRYERNTCFYLWIYRKDKKVEMIALPINQMLKLPVSNKEYKTTLKNIKVYLQELLEFDIEILNIEIERATHVGSLRRN